MKEKTLEIFYIFFLYVNIFLIPSTKQQPPYLPGQYLSDLFLPGDEPNEYLYKAGYYSKSAVINNYYNAQGILISHDNSVRIFNLNILFVVCNK